MVSRGAGKVTGQRVIDLLSEGGTLSTGEIIECLHVQQHPATLLRFLRWMANQEMICGRKIPKAMPYGGLTRTWFWSLRGPRGEVGLFDLIKSAKKKHRKVL